MVWQYLETHSIWNLNSIGNISEDRYGDHHNLVMDRGRDSMTSKATDGAAKTSLSRTSFCCAVYADVNSFSIAEALQQAWDDVL